MLQSPIGNKYSEGICHTIISLFLFLKFTISVMRIVKVLTSWDCYKGCMKTHIKYLAESQTQNKISIKH